MNHLMQCLGCLALTFLVAAGASALSFNQNVTPDVIYGSGNANGSWTVDRSNGVELGLRGKLRHNAAGAPENTFNSNGNGTYSFAAGVAPTQPSPTAVWSFEWSINSNYDGSSGWYLDDLTYALMIDSNPSNAGSAGITWSTFDPIHSFNPATSDFQWDHSIGTNATGNGGGTEISNGVDDPAGYAALIGANNVAQNSWKAHWFLSGFDPTVDGTYNFKLSAFDLNGLVAETEIQIIVGQGGEIPEPTTMALLTAGIAAMAGRRRRII